MKPKDLKFPFRFEERRPVVQDGIFYIPIYYFDHEKWGQISPFINQNPVSIEFCSGNGEWIIRRAMENSEINWIAVEKNFDRVRKIWSKRENLQLKNLFIVSGYAELLVKYYLPKQMLSHAYVNFPDPWPKDKHAKNRLIRAEFIGDLGACLSEDGQVHIVTDDQTYLEQILQEFLLSKDFVPDFDPPYFKENSEGYGESWFERLWKEKGRIIFHTHFRKQNEAALNSI